MDAKYHLLKIVRNHGKLVRQTTESVNGYIVLTEYYEIDGFIYIMVYHAGMLLLFDRLLEKGRK